MVAPLVHLRSQTMPSVQSPCYPKPRQFQEPLSHEPESPGRSYKKPTIRHVICGFTHAFSPVTGCVRAAGLGLLTGSRRTMPPRFKRFYVCSCPECAALRPRSCSRNSGERRWYVAVGQSRMYKNVVPGDCCSYVTSECHITEFVPRSRKSRPQIYW